MFSLVRRERRNVVTASHNDRYRSVIRTFDAGNIARHIRETPGSYRRQQGSTERSSMYDTIMTPAEIVVVGAGMVAHRFVESLLSRAETPLHVTVIGDEGRRPYDRHGLARLLAGDAAEDLELDRSVFDDFRVRFLADDRALRIDRAARTVMTRSRVRVPYDTLVLATGSYAPSVAIEGRDLTGCFTPRTLDDMAELRSYLERRRRTRGRALRAAVIGTDEQGARIAATLDAVDLVATVETHPVSRVDRIVSDGSGRVAAIERADGSIDEIDLVVFVPGARPRDELARNARLRVSDLGGVVVDNICATSDPHILAIGEVARAGERCAVRGSATAEVAATQVLGGIVGRAGADRPPIVAWEHPAAREHPGVRELSGIWDHPAAREDTAVVVIGELARSGMLHPSRHRPAKDVG